MIYMGRQTMRLPQQLSAINAEMGQIDQSTPGGADRATQLQGQMQQTAQQGVQQAQQYLLQQHQLQIQLSQGAQDYQKSVDRANEQLGIQEARSQQNQNIQTVRAQEDFQLQMLQSQQDYQKQVDRSNRDFVYQEQLYVKSVAESIDPWAQVQARSTTDAQMALQNVQQQNKMLALASQQLDALRNMGVSQDTIDVLGLSDPKNIQQLNRFYTDLAQNPQLVDSFNSAIKGRLDWTQGLATDESSTQWQQMEHQFDQAASDASEDFATSAARTTAAFDKSIARNQADFARSTAQSEQDFHTQMDNMATDYETSVKRSLDSINDFASEAYGTAQEILSAAYNEASGDMKNFFSDVIAGFQQVSTSMTSGVNGALPITSGGLGAPTARPRTRSPSPGRSASTKRGSDRLLQRVKAASPPSRSPHPWRRRFRTSPTRRSPAPPSTRPRPA